MRPSYSLFNFEDPICAAVNEVCGLDSIRQRESAEKLDIFTEIAFTAGGATGHRRKTPYDDWIFDLYADGQLEIRVGRYREDAETVDELDGDDPEEQDAVSADPLTHYIAKIRYALRHAMTNSQSYHPLNAVLVNPKITAMVPGPALNLYDEERNMDIIVLTWRVDYGIPGDVWEHVVTGDDGYVVTGDDGSELTGDPAT